MARVDTYAWEDDGSRCPGAGCDCPDCVAVHCCAACGEPPCSCGQPVGYCTHCRACVARRPQGTPGAADTTGMDREDGKR